MINFGVIGTGWITDSYIKSAEATGSWKLKAVYSRDLKKAQEFASKYNATPNAITCHSDEDSLCDENGIQAVYIASPNSLHYGQAAAMLSAKKHVILEKPATSTEAELDKLFNMAKDNGVFLIEANRHIQEVNFKVLQDNLSRVGPLYGASLNYAAYSSRYTNVLNGETPNIFSLDFSGGALVDIGVYPISAAVALFGAPRSQSYTPYITRTGADGGGHITLQYEGFGVSVNCSKCYTSFAPSEIYGQNGTIVINGVADIDRVGYYDAKTKKTEELAKQKAELNLMEEAQEFARIIDKDDTEAARKLEGMTRAVLKITVDLRKQNGLVFGVEKK